METRKIGQAVGLVSLSIGIADILLGKSFARGVWAGQAKGSLLFQGVGMREVATGIAGLVWPTSSVPIWTRFAADLADMAALGAVMAKPANPKRGTAAFALGIVIGAAAMDFLAARAIDRKTGNDGRHGARPARKANATFDRHENAEGKTTMDEKAPPPSDPSGQTVRRLEARG